MYASAFPNVPSYHFTPLGRTDTSVLLPFSSQSEGYAVNFAQAQAQAQFFNDSYKVVDAFVVVLRVAHEPYCVYLSSAFGDVKS